MFLAFLGPTSSFGEMVAFPLLALGTLSLLYVGVWSGAHSVKRDDPENTYFQGQAIWLVLADT